MNWNKIGNNVRKATDGLSSKIFGIMKPSRLPYLRFHRRTELVGNVYPYERSEKIVREIESKKSQAAASVRGFQNR
jgi:hypothetical protein